MIMTKHEAATGTRSTVSRQVTSGQRSIGRPPGTGPITATPLPAKSNQKLAAIMPRTTTSGTGNRGTNCFPRRMTATTETERPTVSRLSVERPAAASQS